MDKTSGCGARRALNARERSGDATSGDATSEARAKPVRDARAKPVREARLLLERSRKAQLSSAQLSSKLDFCSSSRKAEVLMGKARSCVLAYGSPVKK